MLPRECLLKAANCELKAMNASDPVARARMLEIAEHWRNLAKTASAPEGLEGDVD